MGAGKAEPERERILREARRGVDQGAAGRLECPRCDGQLVEREVDHVRIDVCEKCHGTWLDTGELEMVLHLPRKELLRAVHEIGAKGR